MRIPVPQGGAPGVRGTFDPSSPVGHAPQLQQAQQTAQAGALFERTASQAAQVVGALEAAQAEATRRATELAVADALSAYDKAETRRLVGDSTGPGQIDQAFEGRKGGFLATRGIQASESSAQTLQDLEGDVKAIEGKLPPAARQVFRAQVGRRFEASRRRVEQHVAAEFDRAEVSSIEAAASEVVTIAGGDAVDDEEVGARAADVEQRIRSRASSPEVGERAVREFRAQVGEARVKSALVAGDWERAQGLLALHGDHLGADRRAQLTAALTKGQASDAKESQAQALEQGVGEALDKARSGPDGFVDEASLWKAIEALPPAQRDDARKVARDQLRAAQDAEKARVDEAKRTARALYNDRKRMPEQLRGFLQRHDPDYLERLESDAEARWRRWKADRDGSAADRAAARREQTSRDTIAREEFLALPADEQASVDLEVWTPGDVSDEARARLKHLQRNAKDRATRGLTVEEKRFVGEADRLGAQIIKPRRGQSLTPEQDAKRRALSAEASAAFGDFVEREKRAPTEAEQAEILGTLLRDRVTEGPGLFSSTKEPEFLARDRMRRTMGPQQQAAPAADDEVVPLPTTRRMRFPDGSVQPVSVEKLEAARRKGGVPIEE